MILVRSDDYPESRDSQKGKRDKKEYPGIKTTGGQVLNQVEVKKKA